MDELNPALSHATDDDPLDEEAIRSAALKEVREAKARGLYKDTRTDDISVSFLKAFVAAAEHRSFAEAARHIGIKESTLTKRIDALENFLGYALFQRRPHLIVSSEGKRALTEARAICASVIAMRRVDALSRIRVLSGKKPARVYDHSMREVFTSSGMHLTID